MRPLLGSRPRYQRSTSCVTFHERQPAVLSRDTCPMTWTAGGDINVHVIGQVSLDNTAGWRSWNVTQLVDLWYRGRLPNNGLMLAAISTGANAEDRKSVE